MERPALSPVFRLLLVALGSVAATITISRAEDSADNAALSAIAAARGGDWAQAYARAGQIKDGLPLKIIRWLDYTRPTPSGRFADVAGFIDQNPDWPLQKKLQRRAEEATVAEGDDAVADWFKRHPPIGGVGKARAAQILLNHGKTEAGTAALRAAWAEGDFTPSDEHSFLVRYNAMMRSEDHQRRLDRVIWDGSSDAARRMLPLVSAEYRLAAEARLALANEAANAEALLAKVPAALRSDPGVAFDDFAHILARVGTSFGKARAAYWGGRAAEALGKPELATKWYTAGSEHMATFYGQLAAHQLGKDAPPHPVPEPRPSSAEQEHFNGKELVRAARLLFAAGDRDHARNFVLQMADTAKTPVDFAMLA